MDNLGGLDIVKRRLVEFLSFADVSTVEIENLLKVVASMECESTHVTWREDGHYVKFDVGIVWDEKSHKKSKVLVINARTGKTYIDKDLEFSEGTFYGFRFDLKT
jgi:hypothetical protein